MAGLVSGSLEGRLVTAPIRAYCSSRERRSRFESASFRPHTLFFSLSLLFSSIHDGTVERGYRLIVIGKKYSIRQGFVNARNKWSLKIASVEID